MLTKRESACAAAALVALAALLSQPAAAQYSQYPNQYAQPAPPPGPGYDRRDDEERRRREHEERERDLAQRQQEEQYQGARNAQTVGREQQYNQSLVALQQQHNQGVTQLQQQYNRHQISAEQMNAGINALQAQYNEQVAAQQRAPRPLTRGPAPAGPQRARGTLAVAVKPRDGATVLDRFRQEGCLKARLPRPEPNGWTTLVTINSAGGVAQGDRLHTTITAAEATRLTVTSQAAERYYRSPRRRPGAGAHRLCT